MSAHRQHYQPLTPEQRRTEGGLALIVLLACAVLMIGGVIAAILHAGTAGATPTPVATPQLEAFPLEPLPDAQRLADMRVDAFRAGYRMAIEDGCKPAVLTLPFASRQ